jgi:hypothetical protein
LTGQIVKGNLIYVSGLANVRWKDKRLVLKPVLEYFPEPESLVGQTSLKPYFIIVFEKNLI